MHQHQITSHFPIWLWVTTRDNLRQVLHTLQESRDRPVGIVSLDATQDFSRIEWDLLQHEPNPSYLSHAKHPLKLARVQLRTFYVSDSLLFTCPGTTVVHSTKFTRSANDFVGMERNMSQDGLFEPQSRYRGKSDEDLKSFWTCDKIPSFWSEVCLC